MNRRIKEVLHRQITVNFDNKDSLFHRILNVLERHNFSETTITDENCRERLRVLRFLTAYWRESMVRDA